MKYFLGFLAGLILTSAVWSLGLYQFLKDEAEKTIQNMAQEEGSGIQIAACQDQHLYCITQYLSDDVRVLEGPQEDQACMLRRNAAQKYQFILALTDPGTPYVDDVVNKYLELIDGVAQCTK